MSIKIFHICTIANDMVQYEAMKASFIQADFDTNRCRYTLFDNSKSNTYEAYSALNTALTATQEPYLVFCHQDVRVDQEHGFQRLLQVLRELDQQDPAWAVAGNAGAGNDLCIVRRITDPYGGSTEDTLPKQVCTLDENLLIVKTACGVRCSTELTGFHLYGTDLCLNSWLKGYSVYVVDFHLTHLSAGNTNSQEFNSSKDAFVCYWNSHFVLCLLQTPCVLLQLSRYGFIRRLLRSGRVWNYIYAHKNLYTLLANHNFSMKQKRFKRRVVNSGSSSRQLSECSE